MVTSPQYSSVECQTEEHRRALHGEAQRRYRQVRSVRETAEQKRERGKKKVWQKKEGLKLVSLLQLD